MLFRQLPVHFLLSDRKGLFLACPLSSIYYLPENDSFFYYYFLNEQNMKKHLIGKCIIYCLLQGKNIKLQKLKVHFKILSIT